MKIETKRLFLREMTLLSEFTDDEGEQTVVYGISRAEWSSVFGFHRWFL